MPHAQPVSLSSGRKNEGGFLFFLTRNNGFVNHGDL
jgi:hypothetical protein